MSRTYEEGDDESASVPASKSSTQAAVAPDGQAAGETRSAQTAGTVSASAADEVGGQLDATWRATLAQPPADPTGLRVPHGT